MCYIARSFVEIQLLNIIGVFFFSQITLNSTDSHLICVFAFTCRITLLRFAWAFSSSWNEWLNCDESREEQPPYEHWTGHCSHRGTVKIVWNVVYSFIWMKIMWQATLFMITFAWFLSPLVCDVERLVCRFFNWMDYQWIHPYTVFDVQ